MNSAPSSSSAVPGKLLSTSSHSPLQQQQSPAGSQSFEALSRRPGGQSNAPLASPRNNQNHKKQHKPSRRPRLADEDAMAEASALRNASSRRGQTSITHLMNFSLPPRPQYHQHYHYNRGARRTNTYGIGSGRHSIDKARYIHANYRFIVKPYGDYKHQAVDADQHLDWNDVLQILASAESQDASCPICLSHPVAPRMAKCGHIFCLPCLIRYMQATSEDDHPHPERRPRWKKCPICWDSIYISETRPVRWYTGQEGPAPREGDDVVLRLVMRQPGSTLALPRDGAEILANSEDIPWYFAAEVMDYARIMRGSEAYMLEQYDLEIKDLQRQEVEDELMFGEEPEWTRKAMNAIKDAKEKIKGLGDPPAMPKQPAEKVPIREPIQFNPIEDIPDMYLIQHESKSGVDISAVPPEARPPEAGVGKTTDGINAPRVSEITAPQVDEHHPGAKPARKAASHAHPADAPYFFYQALLHYYLAPLDIRILKSAFGNFASFPSTLLPRVERVSTGHVMDDDLRKRAKYMAHLPYGCEVSFLECNWTDVVAPEILSQFKEEIEKRRKRNRDKELREEKDRQRAEREEEEKRWAHARRKRPSTPNEELSSNDFQPLVPPSFETSASSSPPWPARQGSSFASLASPSTSPSGPKTVWGTTAISARSPDLAPQRPPEREDDGWLQSWEEDLLAEDALIAQVQAASLNGESSSSARATPGGKKKKAKKITLMSTTARRAA
ncbi:hypothetical protein F5884DRAFT_62224 [Xylogone sp. PMI_703]|nr:hypothetical protein F5884DRAFT_62224 [Xylogone sp. PMI_703]